MNPFDPVWYRPDNLVAEWQRKDARAYVWRLVTLCVLLVIWMNPPLWPFAGVVDLAGVDGLLMIVEVNTLVGVALFARPVLRFLRPIARRYRVQLDARAAAALFLQRGWPQG